MDDPGVLLTPAGVEDFNASWATTVLEDWWAGNDFDSNKVEVKEVAAKLNSVQGLLSTTYIVDVVFLYEGREETKSLFVKVPLRSGGVSTYHEANLRELCMFQDVLPKLQQFLADKCTDVLQLPIPETVYCNYTGTGKGDLFVLENLLAADYECFSSEHLTKEYLKSCLECVAQLHGTAMAYQRNTRHKDKEEKSESEASGLKTIFPNLNEQSQIKDVLEDKINRAKIRQNFVPFLKYLQQEDASLSSYTGFLIKIEPNLIKILERAVHSGVSNLVTLCHGDAKPDNLLFRRIQIELEELSCEGLEAILIDWQQTFIGCVSNDLMWLLPPFLEAGQSNQCTLEFALDYYFNQVKHVLESFGGSLEDHGLSNSSSLFQTTIRNGFLLEFFSAIIINPILTLKDARLLRHWHRKLLRHEDRCQSGRKSRKPVPPPSEDILKSDQFIKFTNLYCKVAHILQVFPQLAGLNVDLVRERMFREEGEKEEEEDNLDILEEEDDPLTDEDSEEEPGKDDIENPAEPTGSLLSRLYAWILSIVSICNKKK